MDVSNMKNIIVLKNLPSNLVEEAIVVLKENKKVKRYQYADSENVNINKQKAEKTVNNEEKDKDKKYILKEAEMVINNYISKIETRSPRWKNNIKQLEKKYKKSLKLNFVLGISTVISLILSLI